MGQSHARFESAGNGMVEEAPGTGSSVASATGISRLTVIPPPSCAVTCQQ